MANFNCKIFYLLILALIISCDFLPEGLEVKAEVLSNNKGNLKVHFEVKNVGPRSVYVIETYGAYGWNYLKTENVKTIVVSIAPPFSPDFIPNVFVHPKFSRLEPGESIDRDREFEVPLADSQVFQIEIAASSELFPENGWIDKFREFQKRKTRTFVSNIMPLFD